MTTTNVIGLPGNKVQVITVGVRGPQGVGLPPGGLTGEALIKFSDEDYDFTWAQVGVTDGDKGDITVTDVGLTWTINAGVVTNSKLATGIDASKIADGTVSSAEFQRLDGVNGNIQTQIDGKVTANAAITGATKTKITYDAKGLVIGGADATTTDIAEGTNLYYTEVRVSANTDVAANTAARHNAVTIGTASGLSLNVQELSLGLASSGVTGALSGTDWTTFNNKIDGSEKGANNGVATLDGGGKVPISQLPSSILTYEGTWDASTNTPTLADGTGDAGMVYICNVAGTVNFGSGAITFDIGDWVIYNGTIWQKSDNSDAVVSVNSQTGVVVLDADDISDAATTNKFTTAGDISKLAGIESGADVTNATNVAAAGAVMEVDYNANTILAATADDTPVALTVPEQTIIGRITSGNIDALTASEVRTLINVADGATAYTDEMAQDAVGAMVDTTLVYVDATPLLTRAAISGDITISQGSNTAAITAGVIVDADINAAAGIAATKIADGSISNTEFQYLNNVTSNIQTQLDGKLSNISSQSIGDLDDVELSSETIETYLPNTAGNSAYKIQDAAQPCTTLSCDTSSAFSSGELDIISVDSGTSVGPAAPQRGGIRVEYIVPETASNIVSINIIADASDNGDGGPGTMTLFLWNVSTAEYENTGQSVESSTKARISFSLTTNIADYIDTGGEFNILVQTNRGDSMHTPLMYYSEIEVTAGVPQAAGDIIIWNGTDSFVEKTISGDATLAASGAITIADGAITNAKVATGIDAVKIGGGAVSNTEFSYLDGVTSAIQTQINGLVPYSGATSALAMGANNITTTASLGVGTASPDVKNEISAVKNTAITRLRSTTNDNSWSSGSDFFGSYQIWSDDVGGAGAGIKASFKSIAMSSNGANMDLVISAATSATNEVERVRFDYLGDTRFSGAAYGSRTKYNDQTGTTYTIVVAGANSDDAKSIKLNNGSAITVTLPNDAPVGFYCMPIQQGAGQVTFAAASGATLVNSSSHSKTSGQYAKAVLEVITNSDGSSAEWLLAGDTAS